jgi:DNA-binding NtrC family response regulator
MPRLIVLEGPNRGATLRLLPAVNRLGRDASCELALPDEGVSRVHAEIGFEPAAGFRLADLGSKNGTYLNGVRVTLPHALSHGDEIRLGTIVLAFQDDAEDGAAAAETVSGPAPSTAAPAREPRAERRSRSHYLIGESEALKRISALVLRCAPLDSTVLILGESGTGKELVAEALHQLSPRRGGPFLAVNCASLEPSLLESDLFGHERGAFTGAVARKLGKLELARSGTLFLDEVGELPLEAQAKLLRAIERREFQRVGGNELLRTDARLVAATNRDLAALVALGKFRDDLRYRLAVVEIAIPPLRERREDVAPLVEHFLELLRKKIGSRARSFSREAMRALESYRFPGNVRELRNLVERCLIFAEGEAVVPADLPPLGGGSAATREGIETLEAVERAHIVRALEATAWNKTKVAGLLGIDRATLYAKIKRYDLKP